MYNILLIHKDHKYLRAHARMGKVEFLQYNLILPQLIQTCIMYFAIMLEENKLRVKKCHIALSSFVLNVT